MLKQLLQTTLENSPPSVNQLVSESKHQKYETDDEIENALPLIARNEDEYPEYRRLLSSLKKRNLTAFKKVVNFD